MEKLGFSTTELDNMQEFYDRELRKNDVRGVIAVVEFMFKDIKIPKLRRYFVDALTKFVTEFKWFI
jgi:hypothetical protein